MLPKNPTSTLFFVLLFSCLSLGWASCKTLQENTEYKSPEQVKKETHISKQQKKGRMLNPNSLKTAPKDVGERKKQQ